MVEVWGIVAERNEHLQPPSWGSIWWFPGFCSEQTGCRLKDNTLEPLFVGVVLDAFDEVTGRKKRLNSGRMRQSCGCSFFERSGRANWADSWIYGDFADADFYLLLISDDPIIRPLETVDTEMDNILADIHDGNFCSAQILTFYLLTIKRLYKRLHLFNC